MTEQAAAVYLYGVIRDRDAVVLDVPPISGGGAVYTIAHRGLAAVVSDDPLPRYELTRKNIRGHQAVVDGVMRTADILPTRLGTVLPSARSVVENLLEERFAELGRLLEHVRGRVELGLKVSWTDLRQVFREVVADHRDLRALRDRLARNPAAVTYEARVDLGDRAARLLAAKRGREGDELVAALEPHAVGVCRSDPISELMVLNAAFLVDRRRTGAFEAAVADLDQANGGRLGFVLAGPLPPYSFVTPVARDHAQAAS
jgi:gas vesicle protein GvpL/GvpF